MRQIWLRSDATLEAPADEVVMTHQIEVPPQ